MIRILLADDHPLILQGLNNLFAGHADLCVVGEESHAGDVPPAVARLAPDVLVLDLMMPGMGGMGVIREVSRSSPGTGIVVLSMHSNVAYVWEAFRNGALAYVLKCEDSDELILAVRRVNGGQRYLTASIPQHELEEYASKSRQNGLDPFDMLTRRERQVLALVAEGKTSIEIAEHLGIGVRTVETYRANLLAKLDLHNQTELVRYAIKRGIISPL